MLRKLIKSSTSIIEESYNKQDKVSEVLDFAQKKIY